MRGALPIRPKKSGAIRAHLCPSVPRPFRAFLRKGRETDALDLLWIPTLAPEKTRKDGARGILSAVGVLALLLVGIIAHAQAKPPDAQPQSGPVVLDRVVAVVNRHAILSSDIDDEIRLSVIDPNQVGQGTLTPQRALEQLISRSLVEQQIRREDEEAAMPTQAEVDARLAQLRSQLPACVHQNCASDAGWQAFLAEHGLTPERVEKYIRYRMEILHFIELRFRAGIRISQPEIETYYRDTLLPQYQPGEVVPSLNQVAPRIEEILLEQQVNVLFDQWLTSLRKQGDVEILDPSLESAENKSANSGSSE